MKLEYPALFEQEADGSAWNVRFTDFAEAFTYGVTLEEAAYNAREVLDLTLESRLADGETIPYPGTVETEYFFAPSPSIQSAILIHLAREEQHKTLADVARALGTSWPSAARLEDPRHWPTLRQLDRAAAVLGKRLVLCLE